MVTTDSLSSADSLLQFYFYYLRRLEQMVWDQGKDVAVHPDVYWVSLYVQFAIQI